MVPRIFKKSSFCRDLLSEMYFHHELNTCNIIYQKLIRCFFYYSHIKTDSGFSKGILHQGFSLLDMVKKKNPFFDEIFS